MKLFAQSFLYDDHWSIVSLAFFLRYPNPYATHVTSCDVISREFTAAGTLVTTRLILKKGSMPKWAPRGLLPKAESWILEESEVDPVNGTLRCTTKNLDHVKVMRVEEHVTFQRTEDNKTLQRTEARFMSNFGWGLTKRIESHSLERFKANVKRSREGVSLILNLIRQARQQPMTMGGSSTSFLDSHRHSWETASTAYQMPDSSDSETQSK
ncbi:PRELI-like family-domain-containing protein [Irpex lacteus]|nr:PRELI-like family-domain-containing protein [Irpex lacteus]